MQVQHIFLPTNKVKCFRILLSIVAAKVFNAKYDSDFVMNTQTRNLGGWSGEGGKEAYQSQGSAYL
jgi:hypothetical protein